MKNLMLITFILLTFQLSVLSQPCLPSGIIFSTQPEIDNFQTNHPNCTEIEGNVTINGQFINNLNGLSVLTSFGGDLLINLNPMLTDLSGLDSVTYIAGQLWIRDNDAMTSISALSGLTATGTDLFIDNNLVLASLSGLDNVTAVGGALDIRYNDVLTSLSGLENLTNIGANLDVLFNPNLVNLTGLDNVAYIGGNSGISYSDALINLTGLESLTSIGGNLSINTCSSLTSLASLMNLTSIGGNLSIGLNASLITLVGLDNIAGSSIVNLSISDNILLSTCEVKSVCDYMVSPGGSISIHSNAVGCNSQLEVETACGVGIHDINSERKISIYPNPAENKIHISCNNEASIKEISIFNQLGQIVLQERERAANIDISKLLNGIYIIEVVGTNWRVKEKLMVH